MGEDIEFPVYKKNRNKKSNKHGFMFKTSTSGHHMYRCKRKKRYHDFRQAKDVAKRFPGSRAYFCPICNGYHVTTKVYNYSIQNSQSAGA